MKVPPFCRASAHQSRMVPANEGHRAKTRARLQYIALAVEIHGSNYAINLTLLRSNRGQRTGVCDRAP